MALRKSVREKSTAFYSQVDTPTVFIDDRAGSQDLINIPPLSLCGELCRLESGDACFPGNGPDGQLLVGVELKSVRDLVSSMETGRLQATQLPRMQQDYQVIWLLHYGQYRPATGTGNLEIANGRGQFKLHSIGSRPVPYAYLEGFLFTLATQNILVKRVNDLREAAIWIGALARWWGKPWDKHKSLHKFDRSRDFVLKPDIDQDLLMRARTAAAWPGMGYERAIAAARHFPTITEMVLATRKQWEEVPGVGKGLARAITEALTRSSQRLTSNP